MGVVEPVQQRQCQKPWEIVDQPDTGNEGQFSEMARNPHGTPRNPHGTPLKTATEPPAEPPEPTCLEGSASAPCVHQPATRVVPTRVTADLHGQKRCAERDNSDAPKLLDPPWKVQGGSKSWAHPGSYLRASQPIYTVRDAARSETTRMRPNF